MRAYVSGCVAEVSSRESEACLPCRFATDRNRASSQNRNQPTDIKIVEVSIDCGATVFLQRDGGVSAGATIQSFGHKIVNLNLIAGGEQGRVRWPKFHLAQDSAAQTQIRARAITTRRLKGEGRPRQLHAFYAAVFQLDRAGFDIVSRSLDAPFAHGKTNACDVDTAGLRAEGICFAELDLLHGDIRYIVVTLDIDRLGGHGADGRFA